MLFYTGNLELFTNEYGKILYFSSLTNGNFNLLLSFKGSKYHVCKGEWDLKSYMGFVSQPNALLQRMRLDSSKS